MSSGKKYQMWLGNWCRAFGSGVRLLTARSTRPRINCVWDPNFRCGRCSSLRNVHRGWHLFRGRNSAADGADPKSVRKATPGYRCCTFWTRFMAWLSLSHVEFVVETELSPISTLEDFIRSQVSPGEQDELVMAHLYLVVPKTESVD